MKNKIKLNITNLCNMGCEYCNLQNNLSTTDEFIIKKESHRKIIEDFLNDFSKFNIQYQIDLFGGEPFMNQEFIIYLSKLITQIKYKNISIQINTNGTIPINPLISNNSKINIVLSYDGIYNHKTRFLKNQSFLNNYKKNLKILNNYHCVISPEMYPEFSFFDNILYFREKKFCNKKIQIALNKDSIWSSNSLNHFKKDYTKYINFLKIEIKDILSKKIINFDKIFNCIDSFTMYYINTFFNSIDQQGSFGCGVNNSFNYYYIKNDKILKDRCERFQEDNLKEEEIQKSIMNQIKKCQECPINNYCPKGCLHHRIRSDSRGITNICNVYLIIYENIKSLINSIKQENKDILKELYKRYLR